MLAVQAGEVHLPLGTVTLFAVKPGQLRDLQFGALAGEGNKAHLTVAQIEMIELTQKEIAQAVGFKTLIIITARDRRVGQKLQLIKGKVAELPAHVQQALPDIQCQGHAFDFQIAAIFQAGTDVPGIQRRAKVLPAGADLTDVNRYTGGGFDFRQHLWTPAVQMRQNEA